jgi:hypothetical protein
VNERTGVLDAARPSSWSSIPFEELFTLSKEEVEDAQREAISRRFATLRPQIAALRNLAELQGVERVAGFDDVVPVLFDHRVYKSYPAHLVEQRQFGRLTGWLRRLTVHDITDVAVADITSVDAWLSRLSERTPLSVGHTTGTNGKLSFIPRSDDEWLAFSDAHFDEWRALSGYDFRKETMPRFSLGYRRTHYWLGAKLSARLAEADAGGVENRPYQFALSADLLSLAARLRTAEERGELKNLDIDPRVLEERAQLIEQGRRRKEDLQRWFDNLAEAHRGQRVRISGSTPDMVQLALQGRERGMVCSFAEGSVLHSGGGMKGFKDAPPDWEQLLTDFFAINHRCARYAMTECLSGAPRCDKGFYHFLPYWVPILLDENFQAVPREGTRTGRLAFVDLLADSYWGGFITGDRVTIYWDYDCDCGWRSPRIDGDIVRFAELLGTQDDKLTCAGITNAYNEFMDYVAAI